MLESQFVTHRDSTKTLVAHMERAFEDRHKAHRHGQGELNGRMDELWKKMSELDAAVFAIDRKQLTMQFAGSSSTGHR